jgi:hypothetical protein
MAEVGLMADYTGNNSGEVMNQCVNGNAPCATPKLYYFNGNLTYNDSVTNLYAYHQLNAFGVLVVNGNLELDSGTNNDNSIFSGVIFCSGSVTINPGAVINGAVIMGMNSAAPALWPLSMSGSEDQQSMIISNPAMVNYVMNKVCTYRPDTSPRKSFIDIPQW